MVVFGTRPEAIKMAPLVRELKSMPEAFEVSVCVTAQHRQMLDQVLNTFEIVPDIDLDLMRPGQDLTDLTALLLLRMKEVLAEYKPNVLLVHGDTSTTLAAAMAAFYAGVDVGHVEAGLRTYDLHSPFPEEFNRQVVSKLARWHFAPTISSFRNLVREGVPETSIKVTGNTVIDALRWILTKIDSDVESRAGLRILLSDVLPFDLLSTRYILITGHRRENFGDGFVQICQALRELALHFTKVHFVYPVHLNPNVQTPVRTLLSGLSNVHLIAPVDYEPFVYLLRHSYIVLTDSGGIQEEAPSLGKPVLVMRDLTERPEAVSAGTVRLVGAAKDRIVHGVSNLLEDDALYSAMSEAHNPYGDGTACRQIVNELQSVYLS